MKMKIGEMYNCEYLPGEDLRVIKEYSNSMFTVESNLTTVRYLASHRMHDEPHLCLSHVSDELKALKKKEDSFKW